MARPQGSSGTKQLTTEQRQRVRTLYFDATLSQADIYRITGYTKAQIRTAIRAPDATAHRSTGRPRALTPEQEEELVQFICSSKKTRRMGFLELSTIIFAGVFGIWVIKHTLYRLGFHRRVARKKPPITERTRQLRLAWAKEYEHWTLKQWAKVLWTDKTWVIGGPHRKQYITRRKGEEWDPTCIVEKHQRKGGWMFWGCFSGLGKGPGLFWEKEWGKINAESYCAHTVPLIHGWIQLCKQELGEDLVLMQDGAPGHAAAETKKDLQERGIVIMEWPPFSPDLNPIESCWNWMKDWIEDRYGLEEKPSYDRLRGYVKEAWDQLPDEYLKQLLASMPERCKAVIAANGMHTKY